MKSSITTASAAHVRPNRKSLNGRTFIYKTLFLFKHCPLTQMVWSTFIKSPEKVLLSVCLTDTAQKIKVHPLGIIAGWNILEGGMLPDQPDNPTRPKILHPQHARPPPHPHHLSGEPSSLFKTCSRSKVQVIQNSVTMHTLLGYQSRVSTIRSQVGVLITRNRLFTWNNRFLQQHHHPLFTCK